MTDSKRPPRRLYQEFCDFITSFQSLILATVSSEGHPEASYAPVLQHNGRFYIYISELAQHTQNLLSCPKASLLFIEDELQAETLFMRKRATLKVTAQEIERNTVEWHQLMTLFAKSHGDTITMLQQLTDFHLFELVADSAGFVKGFAQAFTLSGDDLSEVQLRNDRGHRQ